jgi:surface polysaccharide O-acyltransferase-like enzyme
MGRKSYIDNLRWLCVLMLFPYHILMIYNSFGENFYVKGEDIKAATAFITLTWPWFMPLLFTVAGISAAFALKKRSIVEYVKERGRKLLIPLISGLLLVIPVQTYFAERFHNGYDGGYFAQYILFFTKPTDLSGYTGGFTPGQLWFVLYLFVISLTAIPFIMLGKKVKTKPDIDELPLPVMLCLFILPVLGSLVLDISGKSLGEYFAYFLLGHFILSDDNIVQKLKNRRIILLGISLICAAVTVLCWYKVIHMPWVARDIFDRLYAWVTVMALIGLGRKHLNMNNRFTAYMSRSSFAVYMFHQTWIVAAAFYVFKLTDILALQMSLILFGSMTATFATYELFKRIGVTRFLFAIKK